MKSYSRMFLFMLSFLFVVSFSCPGMEKAELAKVIVNESGVGGGLCVHLGCGDGKLIAELANHEEPSHNITPFSPRRFL